MSLTKAQIKTIVLSFPGTLEKPSYGKPAFLVEKKFFTRLRAEDDSLVLFVGSMWSFFIHANLRWRLGPLEEIIASPAFHHWHHTLEDHKDRNYAAMLPFMDRLFGTFYLPKAWPGAYGTDTPIPETLAGQLLTPFAPRTAADRNALTPPAGVRAEDR